MRRGAVAALAVAVLTLGSAAGARAQSLWTLTGSPLTATVGQSTTFHMLATNVVGPPAGCVNVEIPSSFVIQSVVNVVAADGASWVSGVSGTWVDVTSASGSQLLDAGEWVSFDMQLLPTQAGAWNWNNHVHVSNQCQGTAYDGAPVTVAVAPAIVPAPVSTPIPTVPPLPTPIPSLPSLPTPRPDPTTTPGPDPTPTPRPSARPQPAPVAGPTGPSDGAGTVGRLAELDDTGIGSIGLGVNALALLDAPLVWFVPGAVVAFPGLLVLLFIALQALGALAWIPAVRRMGGDPIAAGGRRRRRPPGAS